MSQPVPWTDRPLQLAFPPTPEGAPAAAAHLVTVVANVDHVDLDYSPDSLDRVDEILRSFAEQGSDGMAETVWGFGCYLGEVCLRHGPDGRWEMVEQAGSLPVLVTDRGFANPIRIAFARVDHANDAASGPIRSFYDAYASGVI